MRLHRAKLFIVIGFCVASLGIAWYCWPREVVSIQPVASSTLLRVAEDPSPTVFNVSAAVDEINWGPDSETLSILTKSTAAGGRPERHILSFSLGSKTQHDLLQTSEVWGGLASSADGAAVYVGQWRTGPDEVCQILMCDRLAGRESGRLNGKPLVGLAVAFTSDPIALAASPDGRFVAAGTKLVDNAGLKGGHIGGEVCVWNLETQAVHWSRRQTHTDIVDSVAFSPDSKTMASAGADKLIRIWNVESGDLLQTLVGAAWGGISSVAFSPDGKILASGGTGAEDGGVVRLWDIDNGQALHRFATFRRGSNVRVAFAADGRLFATGLKQDEAGNEFRVHAWDPVTGQHLGMLAEGMGAVRAIAISPDGRYLAIGTYEGGLVVFDIRQESAR